MRGYQIRSNDRNQLKRNMLEMQRDRKEERSRSRRGAEGSGKVGVGRYWKEATEERQKIHRSAQCAKWP